MKVYRHGDVNLIEVSESDYRAARKRGTVLPASKSHVLAKGEATGSVHLLEVESADQCVVSPHDWELMEPLVHEA